MVVVRESALLNLTTTFFWRNKMLELLKDLVTIDIGVNNVVFNAKWMLFWPVVIFTGYVYWRAIRSFMPKK